MNMRLLLLALGIMALPAARADLIVTVQPGYTFAPGERPTVDTLNLLGSPTIWISGTIGGTNFGLSAESVTGVQLATSVADEVTIGWSSATPRGLQVLPAGIAGDGLYAAGTNLAVWADTNYFQIATNSVANTNSTTETNWLTLRPESLTDTNISSTAAIQPSKIASATNTVLGAGAAGTNSNLILGPGLAVLTSVENVVTNDLGGGTNVVTTNIVDKLVLTNFVSEEMEIATGQVTNMAHNLGTTPSVVRWVLVCKTNDLGFEVGDEVDAAGARDSSTHYNHFSFGANSTNVFLIARDGNSFELLNKTNGTATAATSSGARWRAKCYARP